MAKVFTTKSAKVIESSSLDAELLQKRDRILKKYNSFFWNKRTREFNKVIKIYYPKEIKIGDIVFRNKGINFNIEISDQNKENKNRYFIFQIIDQNYTKDFILWFFIQSEIQEFLSLYSKWNIIAFLPRKALDELKILLPDKVWQNFKAVNITANSPFKDVIRVYYSEYRNNIKVWNYLSASFMVWAICEAILHQYLVDKWVKEKYLDRKMYGDLLDLIDGLGYGIMNIEDFKKIRDFRNLIHPKKLMNDLSKIPQLEWEIDQTFNRIIKNFWI